MRDLTECKAKYYKEIAEAVYNPDYIFLTDKNHHVCGITELLSQFYDSTDYDEDLVTNYPNWVINPDAAKRMIEVLGYKYYVTWNQINEFALIDGLYFGFIMVKWVAQLNRPLTKKEVSKLEDNQFEKVVSRIAFIV